jgi:hypothetical protein
MTTTTPFGATVTPTKTQDAWKVIDSLTPALKAKITRADNKLQAQKDLADKPYLEDYRQVIDENAPRRDEIIAKARAKRDALIAEAEAEFQASRTEAQKEFEVYVKPISDLYNQKSIEHYRAYVVAWKALIAEVSGQEIA